MNEIANKFLLAGDKFIPEIRLRQPGFTYSACGPFTENEERIQKFKEARESRNSNQNELDKGCFQHDMVYGDFKDLPRRTDFVKLLRVKHLILLKIQNIMNINMNLLQWFITFLIKKSSVIKSEIMPNE